METHPLLRGGQGQDFGCVFKNLFTATTQNRPLHMRVQPLHLRVQERLGTWWISTMSEVVHHFHLWFLFKSPRLRSQHTRRSCFQMFKATGALGRIEPNQARASKVRRTHINILQPEASCTLYFCTHQGSSGRPTKGCRIPFQDHSFNWKVTGKTTVGLR